MCGSLPPTLLEIQRTSKEYEMRAIPVALSGFASVHADDLLDWYKRRRTVRNGEESAAKHYDADRWKRVWLLILDVFMEKMVF